MQYLLEHFGVAVAAVTGVLAAKGKQVDLFGIIVLALVTAFGGGTVRDVTLGYLPVFWIKDPNFLLNAVALAIATFCIARFYEFPYTALLVADAFALSFFTILGAQKALTLNSSYSVAIAMGVITGVAGGILRDVLVGEIPLVFRPQICLYATAALLGAGVFCLVCHYQPGARLNLVIGTTATLLLRLAGIRWKLALPVFS